MAAMINDMLYSQEQAILHHCEGFPTSELDLGGILFSGMTEAAGAAAGVAG